MKRVIKSSTEGTSRNYNTLYLDNDQIRDRMSKGWTVTHFKQNTTWPVVDEIMSTKPDSYVVFPTRIPNLRHTPEQCFIFTPPKSASKKEQQTKKAVKSSSLGEYVGRRLLTDWTVALLVYGAESSPDFEFEQDYTGDFKDCLNKAYEYFDIIKQNDLDAYVTLSGNRTGDEYEFDNVYEIEDTFPDEFVNVESSTKAVKASEEETTEDEFNAVVDTLPKGVKDYLYFLTGDWDEGDAREASICGYLAALVDAELVTSSERRMIERYLTGGDLLHGRM